MFYEEKFRKYKRDVTPGCAIGWWQCRLRHQCEGVEEKETKVEPPPLPQEEVPAVLENFGSHLLAVHCWLWRSEFMKL